MAVSVIVPKLASDEAGATLAEWYCHEGEHVAAGQPLCRLERDFVAFDIEAEAEGVLRHAAAVGEVPEPGATLAYLGSAAHEYESAEGYDAPPGVPEPKPEISPPPTFLTEPTPEPAPLTLPSQSAETDAEEEGAGGSWLSSGTEDGDAGFVWPSDDATEDEAQPVAELEIEPTPGPWDAVEDDHDSESHADPSSPPTPDGDRWGLSDEQFVAEETAFWPKDVAVTDAAPEPLDKPESAAVAEVDDELSDDEGSPIPWDQHEEPAAEAAPSPFEPETAPMAFADASSDEPIAADTAVDEPSADDSGLVLDSPFAWEHAEEDDDAEDAPGHPWKWPLAEDEAAAAAEAEASSDEGTVALDTPFAWPAEPEDSAEHAADEADATPAGWEAAEVEPDPIAAEFDAAPSEDHAHVLDAPFAWEHNEDAPALAPHGLFAEDEPIEAATGFTSRPSSEHIAGVSEVAAELPAPVARDEDVEAGFEDDPGEPQPWEIEGLLMAESAAADSGEDDESAAPEVDDAPAPEPLTLRIEIEAFADASPMTSQVYEAIVVAAGEHADAGDCVLRHLAEDPPQLAADQWPVLASYEGAGVFEATSRLHAGRPFTFALGDRRSVPSFHDHGLIARQTMVLSLTYDGSRWSDREALQLLSEVAGLLEPAAAKAA